MYISCLGLRTFILSKAACQAESYPGIRPPAPLSDLLGPLAMRLKIKLNCPALAAHTVPLGLRHLRLGRVMPWPRRIIRGLVRPDGLGRLALPLRPRGDEPRRTRVEHSMPSAVGYCPGPRGLIHNFMLPAIAHALQDAGVIHAPLLLETPP